MTNSNRTMEDVAGDLQDQLQKISNQEPTDDGNWCARVDENETGDEYISIADPGSCYNIINPEGLLTELYSCMTWDDIFPICEKYSD